MAKKVYFASETPNYGDTFADDKISYPPYEYKNLGIPKI